MALSLSRESLTSDKAAEKTAAALVKLQEMQLGRRLGMMVMIAAAVAVGLMVFFWSQGPNHTPLYTGLDAKATAEAADLLRAAQIPVKIDQATGAISVPEQYLHEARLKLAESKLTDSGRLGFELMERDPGFGVSQFIETARYQHALETELVRTITTLRPVRDARVHLAIPKPSAFTRKRDVASASVVLELRSGASLTQAQVDAIAHMVASSIPDLAPERVTVVDQSGQLLTRLDKDSDEAISAAQFEQVRRQETTFNRRIRELLEPMTGAGRVNAEVTVDMDFSVTEEAREVYGEPPKLRSEQVSENSTTTRGPEGIPGAASNTPPGPDAEATADSTPLEHAQSATRNFELDRTLQHTRQPGGRIRRVTTAVLIDHVPRPDAEGNLTLQALSDEELAKVEALVQQAVGFDAARGDMVSVMNTPFVHDATDILDEPLPWWQEWWARDALRLGLGALVLLALLFGVLRPAFRQLTGAADKKKADEAAPGITELDPETAAALADDNLQLSVEAQEQAAMTPPPAPDLYEQRLQLAREAVRADSARVAQVVKGWIGDEN